ncbi:GNAT family N-acetyltransferase [Fictibacillus sp. BK138]|uniref:GNAT family N-acetyltransferase n=1 Tax=Fictibacillus sp. BK138 TaxID=2512121 RepID=UPI0010298BFE|nr:GNAT family N-acetyltransferase [Fictibacillus sp. BK138]RZT23502.1 acetyltransferase (GNAT) family protein [Fictibacillus sp. BK138]
MFAAWHIEQVEERFKKIYEEKDSIIFLYEMNNTICGWVHVYGKCIIQLEYAEIGGLVVDTAYRGKGIGKHLMRKAEEWAIEKGYSEIRLRSGGHRKEAHDFYERIGYENIKWQEVFSRKL